MGKAGRPGGQRDPERQDEVAKADVGPAHMVPLMFLRGPLGAPRGSQVLRSFSVSRPRVAGGSLAGCQQ